ncbi:MAG TPA: hypothetical protein VEC60_10475 [Reyranella sp.]|nr:hypothetical protein [Reyranella sp.]
MILGKSRNCESNVFRIDDGREGAPIVILMDTSKIPCPPEVQ